MRPARPSAVDLDTREPGAAEGAVCALKEVYRAIALQAPLEQTLGELSRKACEAAGAALAVVFGLKGEHLRTLAASGELPLWLRPPAELPPDAVPWWRLRGEQVRMGEEPRWLPYKGLAGGVDPVYKPAVAFAVLIAALLLRPQGLLGRAARTA